MAEFTVTVEFDSADDHEKSKFARDAAQSLGTLRIEIDTAQITRPLPHLLKRVIGDWVGFQSQDEIKDNGKIVGHYWTETE